MVSTGPYTGCHQVVDCTAKRRDTWQPSSQVVERSERPEYREAQALVREGIELSKDGLCTSGGHCDPVVCARDSVSTHVAGQCLRLRPVACKQPVSTLEPIQV